MAEPEKKTLWSRIGDILQAKEIYTILSSTTAASWFALWVGSILPPGYDTQAKIFVGIGSFAGAGLITLVLTNAAFKNAWKIQRWRRRAFGDPPQLKVTPYRGETAILEILNEGGAGLISARAQIVAAHSDSHPLPHINRHDDYPMVWRSDFQPDTIIVVRETMLRKGGSAKILLAGFVNVHGLVRDAQVLRVFGGDYRVDEFPFNYGYANSPVVTIKVNITADPPLRQPFIRFYSVQIPSRTPIVNVREVPDDETRNR